MVPESLLAVKGYMPTKQAMESSCLLLRAAENFVQNTLTGRRDAATVVELIVSRRLLSSNRPRDSICGFEIRELDQSRREILFVHGEVAILESVGLRFESGKVEELRVEQVRG